MASIAVQWPDEVRVIHPHMLQGYEKDFGDPWCAMVPFLSGQFVPETTPMRTGHLVGTGVHGQRPENLVMRKIMDFEVLINTYGRQAKVEEQLLSLRVFFPDTCVQIADDGPQDLSSHFMGFCQQKKCRYTWVGHDVGPAAKRNWLVNHSSATFLFVTDDDMLWTSSVDVEKMIELLQHADVVTCGLSDRHPLVGSIHFRNGKVFRCPTDIQMVQHNCYRTEYGLQILLARRTFLLEHRWDDALVLREHEVFFLSIKNVAKVVACPDMQFIHNNKNSSIAYDKMRNRATSQEFNKPLAEKYGIHTIVFLMMMMMFITIFAGD